MLRFLTGFVLLVLVFSLVHGQSTPLHEAAGLGDDEAVRALLAAGVDINATDEDGNTALYLAAEYEHEAVVEAIPRSFVTDFSVYS